MTVNVVYSKKVRDKQDLPEHVTYPKYPNCIAGKNSLRCPKFSQSMWILPACSLSEHTLSAVFSPEHTPTHSLWLSSHFGSPLSASVSKCFSPSLAPVATHPQPACVRLKVFMCVLACECVFVCQSEWPLLSTAPSLLGIPLPLTPPSLPQQITRSWEFHMKCLRYFFLPSFSFYLFSSPFVSASCSLLTKSHFFGSHHTSIVYVRLLHAQQAADLLLLVHSSKDHTRTSALQRREKGDTADQ